MRAKKPPKREFALININKKCLVLRAGKPIIINVGQPPRGENFSRRYSRTAGYDFAVVEIEYSHHHTGEPVYDWPDEQKAIIRKTIKAQSS
jgi:hypothetical protein